MRLTEWKKAGSSKIMKHIEKEQSVIRRQDDIVDKWQVIMSKCCQEVEQLWSGADMKVCK